MKTAFLLPALFCALITLSSHAADADRAQSESSKLDRARQQLEELRRNGRPEEAEKLERQIAEAQRRSGGKGQPSAEGPERVNHVIQAAGHLRAAGLNEPAENLEKMAKMMREEMERRGNASNASGVEAALREMRERMEQMQQQMQKMQRQMEELRSKG